MGRKKLKVKTKEKTMGKRRRVKRIHELLIGNKKSKMLRVSTIAGNA